MLVLHKGRLVLDGAPGALLGQTDKEDLARYGLNLPPVVRAARALGMNEAPLSVGAWKAALTHSGALPDLGRVREALSAGALCPGRPVIAAPEDDLVLRTEALTFAHTRGQPVLREIDLALRARESLALVGANGSGKTTLIKHFNGLHHPQSGRVWVLGQDTRRTRVSRLARQVGMVFQNANDQFFKFNVRDEIEAGARALGVQDEDWLDELIALLDLAPLLDRSPYRLSEGEKKRVAFCSALAARPEILVLDEPTTGQDWGFRRALGRLLEALLRGELRGRGQTVVLVTHDLEFAEGCAGRWALLFGGEILTRGTPAGVMADEETLHRAGLEATQAFRLRRALDALPADGVGAA
jgi:energy-coupling factor transport system ATP-binding protein